jgi:hypothetical protein
MSKLWLPTPVPIFQSRSNSMLNKPTDLKFFLYQLIISKSIDLPFLWIKSLLYLFFSYTFYYGVNHRRKFWSALLMPNQNRQQFFSVGLYFPKGGEVTWTFVELCLIVCGIPFTGGMYSINPVAAEPII